MMQTTDEVILGVDTHDAVHVGVLIDAVGRRLGVHEIAADRTGYQHLLQWCGNQGQLHRAGVEGTGSYGAALARFLVTQGIQVIEVNRPNRQRRRRHGKSDPVDAEAAARAVLAGDATAIPKTHDGMVEALRVLQVARASAVKARTQAANQLTALVVTASEELQRDLRSRTTPQRVDRCARLRVQPGVSPGATTRRALRHLARRWQSLDRDIGELDVDLAAIVRQATPRLLAEPGVGPGCVAELLIAAGDNPERLRTDAALAALCGVSPIEASSGKVVRHRLNRGGNRQANTALWTIATNRLRHHPETQDYADRRTREGRSQKEIIRCLMRYLARRLYPLLVADLAAAGGEPSPDEVSACSSAPSQAL